MKTSPVIRPLLSCFFLLLGGGSIHGHVFTNPDGKTFEGNIVNGNEKTVTIERTVDKKAFTIERSRLSNADQTEVAKWVSANPDIRLSVRTVKKPGNNEKTEFGSSSSDCYEIEIRNNSAQATPQLTMRYILRTLTDGSPSGRSSGPYSASGTIVPSIPAFKTRVIRSNAVETSTSATSHTETKKTSNGRERVTTHHKSRTSLSGISLIIFHNERKVADCSMIGMEKQAAQLLEDGNPPGAPVL